MSESCYFSLSADLGRHFCILWHLGHNHNYCLCAGKLYNTMTRFFSLFPFLLHLPQSRKPFSSPSGHISSTKKVIKSRDARVASCSAGLPPQGLNTGAIINGTVRTNKPWFWQIARGSQLRSVKLSWGSFKILWDLCRAAHRTGLMLLAPSDSFLLSWLSQQGEMHASNNKPALSMWRTLCQLSNSWGSLASHYLAQ